MPTLSGACSSQRQPREGDSRGALDSAGEKKIQAVLGKYLATEAKGLPW